MTVLSAAQEAAVLLVGRKPASLFASDVLGNELGVLATEAATAIMEYHEWQVLKKLAQHNGFGSQIPFDLPDDFDRMLKKGAVHSSTWKDANFRPARDEDEWIYLQDVAISGTPGVWIILGGFFQIFPAMALGEFARYYYVSNKIVRYGGNNVKKTFTADDDEFLLSERLLKLSLIWRWRSLKRMEYSEDLANYEIALAEAAGTDKGARPIVVGRQRLPTAAAMAYPGTIVP